jgi:hypothetical protein
LTAYVEHYLKSRTHLALNTVAPVSRSVAAPDHGKISHQGFTAAGEEQIGRR